MMEIAEIIQRLRRMRGPDERGCHLGDGINPGVRAGDIANALEKLEALQPEKQWDRFIAHLNATVPLKDDGKHQNFLGSIAQYRKVFLNSAKAGEPE